MNHGVLADRVARVFLSWTDKVDDRPRPPRMKKPKVTPSAHRIYKEYTQDLLHDILVDKYGTKRGTENFEYFVDKGGGAFYAVGQQIQDEKAQMYLDLGERPPSDYWSETYFDVWKRWMERPASKQVNGGDMNRILVARELVALAKSLMAIEFDSQEAYDKYMKSHPDADKSNHSVKRQEKKSPAKNDSGAKGKKDNSPAGKASEAQSKLKSLADEYTKARENHQKARDKVTKLGIRYGDNAENASTYEAAEDEAYANADEVKAKENFLKAKKDYEKTYGKFKK